MAESVRAKYFKRRSRRLDFFIVLLCLSGAAASLYLFYADLFMTLNSGARQAGTVYIKENTVQRRLADRNIWDRLYNNSPVYDGDLIRIARVSSATLNLGDNSVELGENTLIRVYITDDAAQIDFSYGEINIVSTDGSKPVLLTIGDRTFEASEGTVISAVVDDTGTKLQITEAGGQITSEGDVQKASPVLLFFDNEGSEIFRPAAAMIQPRPAARYLKSAAAPLPVNFSWDKVNINPADRLRLEIAGDRNFTRIIRTLNNLDTSAAVSLESGLWHWRIFLNENILSAGRFTVTEAAPPILLNPASGSQVQFNKQRPEVRFQWTEAAAAQFYILQVSSNRDLSNPQINTQVQRTSFISSTLEEGTWYWQVIPVYPSVFQGDAAASVTSAFSVSQRESLETFPLNSPAADAALNVGSDRANLFFSWAGSPNAESYTIYISASEDLNNPVIRETVHDNFFIYQKDSSVLLPGKYYWSVFYLDNEGNTSSFAKSRSFTAVDRQIIQRLTFPQDRQNIEIDELQNTNFEWISNITHDMRLQISASSDFSSLTLNREVTGDSLNGISLPAGEWFWRISARDDALSPVSVSRSRRFSVVEPPPPIAPVPEPAPVAAAVTPPPVPAQTVSPPRSQTRTPSPAQAQVQPQPPPQPQPQVRQEPPARVEPPPPLRLTLVSPAQNTTLPGLTALREPTVFSWEYSDTVKSGENIASSRFTLSRSAGGRAEVEIRNPSRAVTIDKLAEGLWYWTVEAVSEDGRPITAETPRQLRVQQIPLLPPPENLLPERNHRIIGDELRTTRDIIFEWAAVEDANAYILTIYKDTPLSRQRIFQSEPLSELNYTFAELTLLDFNSEYIWQVEAVFINSEGVIEQRGSQGENSFILDVSGPGRVQPEEAGVLYGF